ncbi:hypothetical protein BY458DRAFT_488071 [Sporodiniella umbellata]|nr:hypothetical protein BY458DRAFT_488071 [Sporodiniella umbellata]
MPGVSDILLSMFYFFFQADVKNRVLVVPFLVKSESRIVLCATMRYSNTQYQQWLPHSEPTHLFEAPVVIDYSPNEGYAGDAFVVNTALNDLNSTLIRIAFGSCVAPTHFSINAAHQTISFHSQLPSSNLTSTHNTEKIPIYVLMIREGTEDHIQVLDSWFIGYFAYSNKRGHLDEYEVNTKRSRVGNQQHSPSPQPYMTYPPNYYSLPYMGLPSSSRVSDMDATAQMLNYPSYRPPDPSGGLQFPDSQPSNFVMPMLHSNSSIQMRPPQSIVSNTQMIVSPTSHYPQGSSPHQQHGIYSHHMPQLHPIQPLAVTHPNSLQPIQPQSAVSIVPALSTQTPVATGHLPPDPFANVLSNARLRIENDLSSMIKDWTEEERKNKRRLVQFWRRQEGTESIFARFNIHRAKQSGDPPDFVVSCIYWEEKEDYYVTSVDCISLLQFLIGVMFTVEEKNRVRRNLEGFEPETISKHKEDTVEFFRLVMGFPKPKPRNIEKDLKVFKWSKLDDALQKIVSKFTASYSTTQSIITESDNHYE